MTNELTAAIKRGILDEQLAAILENDWIYDIETYPNIFTFWAEHAWSNTRVGFEISPWCNDLQTMLEWFHWARANNVRMVGFNNVGFDYPVMHYILQNHHYMSVELIYAEAQRIISTPWNNRFDNIIYDNDCIIPQVDLFKIHHFDNTARATSLKMIEYVRRSQNIGDLPFPAGTAIPEYGREMMHTYNGHDVSETKGFYHASIDQLKLRANMQRNYGLNCINWSNSKIGKEFLIKKLEEHDPNYCYDRSRGRREPRQTPRPYGINLGEVIFPYVRFEQPEFNRVLNWLRSQTILETKGVFKDLSATVGGLEYVFGTGGLHGSMSKTIVRSTRTYILIDVDVKSYYPNLGIKNRLYPEHMGPEFCTIYEEFYNFRGTFAKKSSENLAVKLGLNSVYGDSNNQFSVFLDPKYTMAITINGQLLLCMLAEQMLKIDGLTVVQANTDGITVLAPRVHSNRVLSVCREWEGLTHLTLETETYESMHIRDVNAYLAKYTQGSGGGIKRKGCYRHGIDIESSAEIQAEQLPLLRNYKGELQWHQDHSAYIIAIAAEQFLLNGVPIRDTVLSHTNALDFMMVVKTTSAFVTYIGDTPQQRVTRYYISRDGGDMYKLKKSTGDRTGINIGWKATECNNLDSFQPGTINADYYIREAEKICQLTEYNA